MARYASDALKAGVEERQTALMEKTGQQFMTVIQTVLDGLGLSDEQKKIAPKLIRDALLAGGSK